MSANTKLCGWPGLILRSPATEVLDIGPERKSHEKGGEGTNKDEPVVVIVGGGFGGLAAIKALRKTKARVILIDRANHHLFQPLLYQVATSVLAPGQIASPIRGILRH